MEFVTNVGQRNAGIAQRDLFESGFDNVLPDPLNQSVGLVGFEQIRVSGDHVPELYDIADPHCLRKLEVRLQSSFHVLLSENRTSWNFAHKQLHNASKFLNLKKKKTPFVFLFLTDLFD